MTERGGRCAGRSRPHPALLDEGPHAARGATAPDRPGSPPTSGRPRGVRRRGSRGDRRRASTMAPGVESPTSRLCQPRAGRAARRPAASRCRGRGATGRAGRATGIAGDCRRASAAGRCRRGGRGYVGENGRVRQGDHVGRVAVVRERSRRRLRRRLRRTPADRRRSPPGWPRTRGPRGRPPRPPARRPPRRAAAARTGRRRAAPPGCARRPHPRARIPREAPPRTGPARRQGRASAGRCRTPARDGGCEHGRDSRGESIERRAARCPGPSGPTSAWERTSAMPDRRWPRPSTRSPRFPPSDSAVYRASTRRGRWA